MSVPLSQMWTVATYVLEQRLRGRRRYPLVLMLEPLFRCNLACAGCGKIQYPAHVLRKHLTVEQCLAAVEECGAPMVSIPGGEPLMYPDIGPLVEALVARRKYVYLCTNALLLRDRLDGPVGPVGCSIYSHEFYETDLSRGFTRGVHLQLSRENALVVQASRLSPLWGEAPQAQLREEFLHTMPILVLVEDLPEPHNRVCLTRSEERDGLPGVKIDYRIAERAQKSLDFGLARLATQQREAP